MTECRSNSAAAGAPGGSRLRIPSTTARFRWIASVRSSGTWEKEGVLESIYPNIFVVKLNERKIERRVSYSYADVLTETVELFVYDNNNNDLEIKIASSNR